MSKQFKILTQFVKDMSCETPDVETYFYVKEYLKNYNLNLDITTKPLKNRMIEINTKLTYSDKGKSKNKSHFEIIYASIVNINEEIKDRKVIEKIILCDTQKEIYPNLEKIFINLLTSAGFPGIKFEKKIDFEQLYKQRIN
ncbi:protein-export chaperone SecB [Candidatus Pelagibacter sp.]|jgi:preprotein translocase subunit SecB|nr:protein-export chaperone SecB [Candidatus Pelagibacter sp.]